MKIKIIHYNGYFGESMPTYIGMDVTKLCETFNENGFDTELMSVEDLQFEPIDENCYYLCGSHQNTTVKQYYDDVLDVPHISPRVIPARRLIRAHDNKGYQGMLAKSLGLAFTDQRYYVDQQNQGAFPLVAKSISGAGSKGVYLCSDNADYFKFLRSSKLWDSTVNQVFQYSKAKLKDLLKKGSYRREKIEFHQPRVRHVHQSYLPNLDFDYKVLVFMDKCFVLKRWVRDNDFRASGSGKFEFITPDESLLEFALDFRKKVNTPYVSLDIVEVGDGYQCIEYQCVHFGPYTQINAPHYYIKSSEAWETCNNDTLLESLIAESVVQYLSESGCHFE